MQIILRSKKEIHYATEIEKILLPLRPSRKSGTARAGLPGSV